MKAVYFNSGIPEKKAKEVFCFPEGLMMENAAAALEKVVLNAAENQSEPKVLIVSGSGNNGADGIALGRRLFKKIESDILLLADPKTSEGKMQLKMATAMGCNLIISSQNPDVSLINLKQYSIIVDCIFGTGFHGQLPNDIAKLVSSLNSTKATRIACDIPTGLCSDFSFPLKKADIIFKADYTVTMGALKIALFSDTAKTVCGKIVTAELGISSQCFETMSPPEAYLLEPEDMKLPLRHAPSFHKGKFGHTTIIAGEKSGAAIISAAAAMNFGSGLTSLLKTKVSNISQFKISPSLMLCNTIPQKTTCIGAGSGLGLNQEEILQKLTDWFIHAKTPACVLDADIFSYKELPQLLEKLNSVPNGKIILTPHLAELEKMILSEKQFSQDFTATDDRLIFAIEFTKKYKNIVLIMKSAITIIAAEGKLYICNSGSQCLAKGGSGDVLAGLCASLLAQNYNAKDAALTAVLAHATASSKAPESYSLTPEKLIEQIGEL